MTTQLQAFECATCGWQFDSDPVTGPDGLGDRVFCSYRCRRQSFRRCGICEEPIDPEIDQAAEMHDATDPRGEAHQVHIHCGLALRWEVA